MALFNLSRRRILALLGVQSALLPNVLSSDSAPAAIDEAGSGAAGDLSRSAIGRALYPRTAGEAAANVTPANFAYPPGNPRRYGAAGDGVTDDTAALTACISCNDSYVGNEGDIYGVITVTFPRRGPRIVRFN